ncbi:aromatic ring-hydroxylating dioxygenase subunit alpha [Pseudomonas nitroreducens]|uniref:aromatic ring-hydroxylating dioxygenase subunit alpha n=1 Tax=Pseudomonas nitroreducens TaxID=46680 RepID=UPI00209D0FFD|nr:aromatic ring-hydroxylating dioxygenase subunit alpha [Pseudomonas nitroreducens]MCP1625920.1 vanillate O-demethylase monooxygenase subunit [Pseudomonas nitroreducens]
MTVSYLRNTWYAAAWDTEVEAGQLFPRTLLDEPVLLYRDSQGIARAIGNRCPHRFAPLHMGCLKGDEVQCAYHGLRFDSSGACTHNPHGDGVIPRAAKVRAYPLVERHSLLWIWMGDPALADPQRIPDFSCMDAEHWYVGKGYLHAKANYVLETDNIMDLSHVEFLHPATLGGEGVKSAITSVEQEGDSVWSNRQTVAEIMPDFLYQALNIPHGTPVDRWIDVRWDAPANMLLYAGAVPTGRPRSEGVNNPIPHLFTPETGRTTHYWFAMCFPKAMGPMGEQLAREQVEAIRQPFAAEDLPMLEAQQEMMGDAEFWSLKPVLLVGDAGAIRARRVLDRLIAEERSAAEVAKEAGHA